MTSQSTAQHSVESVISVLELKVNLLSSSITEIKDSVKRIEDVVSLIKLVEAQANQQTRDVERLTQTVHNLHTTIQDSSSEFENKLDVAKRELTKKIADADSKIDANDDKWKERWNLGRGLWLGVTILLFTFGGVGTFAVSRLYSNISEMYDYYKEKQFEERYRRKMEGAQLPPPDVQPSAQPQQGDPRKLR